MIAVVFEQIDKVWIGMGTVMATLLLKDGRTGKGLPNRCNRSWEHAAEFEQHDASCRKCSKQLSGIPTFKSSVV